MQNYQTSSGQIVSGNDPNIQGFIDAGATPAVKPKSFDFERGDTPAEKARRELIDLQQTALPDEDALRNSALEARQGLISSVNSRFDERIRQTQRDTAGDVARTRALGSVTGTLGSPRGSAQREGVKEAGRKVEATIEDERQFRLENIFASIDKTVDEKFKTQRADAIAGREANVTFLEEQATKDKDLAASFISSGGDVDVLSDEDYGKLRELVPDMSNLEFDLFADENKPTEAKDVEITSKWENGNFVRITQSPSGEIKTKTYTAEELGLLSQDTAINPAFVDIGGRKFFYDKDNLQLDASGKPILQDLGSTSKPKSGKEPDEFDNIKTELEDQRGEDGFVSPDDYAAAKADWIQANGTPPAFDRKFKDRRNPNNPNYDVTGKEGSAPNQTSLSDEDFVKMLRGE